MDNVGEILRSPSSETQNRGGNDGVNRVPGRQEEAKRSHPSLLNVIDTDYHLLPGSFEVDSGFLYGVSAVRVRTEMEKTEVGGVLTRGREGRTALKMAGRNGDMFGLRMAEITDEFLPWFTKGLVKTSDEEGTNNFHIIFVDKDSANANAEYFKGLVDNGIEVVLDKTPVGIVHSHPSGNLPSTGDFAHTVVHDSLGSSVRPAEVVVTAEYTYFLLPTKQTPDLTNEIYMQGGLQKWREDEDSTIRHLADAARINGVPNPNPESYCNAFRQRFLQEQCIRNKVGFYALKNGDTAAQRIV